MKKQELTNKEFIEFSKSFSLNSVILQLAKSFQEGDSYCTFKSLTFSEMDIILDLGFTVEKQGKTWFISK